MKLSSLKLTIISIATLLTCVNLHALEGASYQYNPNYHKNILAESGAKNIISAYRVYSYMEHNIANKIDISNDTLAQLGRATKVLFLDFPIASFAIIAQHEYFGHGGRLRDVGIKNIRYNINILSGVTYFPSASYNARTLPKRAAINAGGMESTLLLAHRLNTDSFIENNINSSDAMLNIFSTLDTYEYIESTKSSSTANNPGHDVTRYINEINSWYGSNVLTSKDLRNKNIVNLINPFLWFNAYDIGKYIYTGERNNKVPTLQIGNIKYLPYLSLYLAPYGPEYHFHNYISDSSNRVYLITFRHGSTGNRKSNGISAVITNLYKNKKFSFDVDMHAFKQPEIDAQLASGAKDKTGLMIGGKVNYALLRDFHTNAHIAYKSKGYIPGKTLSSGVMLTVGVFFRI